MTPAELTALEAELRYTAAARAMRHSATTPTGYVEYRAADAIADLRRKLDEAREVIRRAVPTINAVERLRDIRLASYPRNVEEQKLCEQIDEFTDKARRWMEDN